MSALDRIRVVWQQSGLATALARITARDGTGAWTGIFGEGNFIKPADISAITCAVYDLSSSTPGTPFANPSVTTAAILDPPVTDQKIWDLDTTGYNFLFDLPAANFPTANHKIAVVFTFTASSGNAFPVIWEGVCNPLPGN